MEGIINNNANNCKTIKNMSREKVEKYIEKKLKEVEGVEKVFIEKKDKESIDVVVVSSDLNPATSGAISDLEIKVNKDFKIPSEFRIYPVEAW